jgi:hypothetical protein
MTHDMVGSGGKKGAIMSRTYKSVISHLRADGKPTYS